MVQYEPPTGAPLAPPADSPDPAAPAVDREQVFQDYCRTAAGLRQPRRKPLENVVTHLALLAGFPALFYLFLILARPGAELSVWIGALFWTALFALAWWTNRTAVGVQRRLRAEEVARIALQKPGFGEFYAQWAQQRPDTPRRAADARWDAALEIALAGPRPVLYAAESGIPARDALTL